MELLFGLRFERDCAVCMQGKGDTMHESRYRITHITLHLGTREFTLWTYRKNPALA